MKEWVVDLVGGKKVTVRASKVGKAGDWLAFFDADGVIAATWPPYLVSGFWQKEAVRD